MKTKKIFFYYRYAILNEAWRLVADGILDVKDIDTVMSEGLGMRYAFLGPFETAHLNAEGKRLTFFSLKVIKIFIKLILY